MNLCIVSFQAVLFTVLVQYHYINEVEAEKKPYVSISNWYNGLEKKVDDFQSSVILLSKEEDKALCNYTDVIQRLLGSKGVNVKHRIRMNKVFQRIKKTTENILAYPSHLIHKAFGTGTDNKKTYYNKDTDNRDTVNNEGVTLSDLLNSQELRHLVAVNDISDLTSEVKYDAEPEPEAPHHVVLEKLDAHKRKRRIKKHKKKTKGKREQREHLPREQRLDASDEQDKVQFGKRDMRKNHKKREKEIISQRKFVKTVPKESNSSESDEVIRRKPVDIIVHIKMND